MKLCLDTSAYSRFKRGNSEVVELLDHASWIGVPAIVLGELRVGFQLGMKRAQNEKELRRFLESSCASVLEVDEEATFAYAEIVIELRKAGTPIPTNDVWIAALAAREGATVLTFDAHFEHVGRVGRRVIPGGSTHPPVAATTCT